MIGNGYNTSVRTATERERVEAETPLLNDVVHCSVDFNGRPTVRSKSGCWKSASFIIGVEMGERFAYFGIVGNLISYLTGPLGQSTATAAANVNAWSGTASLSPLLGAFIADSFLGRYRTIIIATLLYILGLGFLTLSAVINPFKSSDRENGVNYVASCSPPQLQMIIIFFFSLYLVALAQGGHKPCLQAFGADQFDEDDQQECKAKSSFFNWWNFCQCISVLASLSVLNYIQENLSWGLGFGIPCIVMCFALFIFLLGSMTYRFHTNSDERNPFLKIGRVFLRMARNCRATPKVECIEKEEANQNLSNEDCKSKCLDNGLEDGNVCTTDDVEDANTILRLVPIWLASLGYGVAVSQISTLFVKQGATMDRGIVYGFQIPAASLQFLSNLSIVVFIPIYDRILVPISRDITKKPSGISMLQRVGIGIFLSFLCMVIAAVVERQRLSTALEYMLVDEPKATVPMSVWWLAPQYLLFGVADVFTVIGLQEFFYDQTPSELKSVGLALYQSIFGIGNFLSSFLISIIEKVTSGDGRDSWFSNNLNRAHLDYFYCLLAGLSAVTTAAYVYLAISYVYKRKEEARS